MATDIELRDFLNRIDRLIEPALLFAPHVDTDHVLHTMETVFGTRHVFSLRATGPIPLSEGDVNQTIRNSFEAHGVLAVLLNDKVPPNVVQAVSRLCNDGVLAEKKDGVWSHHKPPEEWRMVVLAEVGQPESLPGGLGDLFPAVMAL